MGAGRADFRALTAPSPLVLLVGCPAAMVTACREAAQRLGVSVQECAPGELRAPRTGDGQPFVIVVPEEIYDADRAAFDALARRGASSLLRLPARIVSHGDAERRIGHLVEAVMGATAELLAEAPAD